MSNVDRVVCVTQNGQKCRTFSTKMSRFNQLLNSKYFLLVFVNTLDRQLRDFSLHDRSALQRISYQLTWFQYCKYVSFWFVPRAAVYSRSSSGG